MAYELETQQLFDTLTAYDCTSRDEIAAMLGWPVHKVDSVLAHVRRSRTIDFVVPHVPSGRGEHLYQAVLVDKSRTIGTQSERSQIMLGALSAYRSVTTVGSNGAHNMREAAPLFPKAVADRMRRAAAIAEGQAALTPIDELLAMLDKEGVTV